GFYTLQWGPLGEFELKGLSAEAKFIREKRQEVAESAENIATLKRQVEERAKEAAEITSRLRQLEEHARPRSLDPSPRLIAALNTEPRGPVYVISDDYENEIIEHFNQWRKLFEETGWGDTGGTILHFQDWNSSYLEILRDLRGVTLVIRKGVDYGFH